MEQQGKLAHPYAVAAFGYAQKAGATDQWSEALDFMAKVVTDRQMAGLIANPAVDKPQLTELLLDIGGDRLGSDTNSGAKNFLRVLVDNGRLGLLPAIAEQFEEERAKAERRSQVVVTSAKALSDDEKGSIESTLSKYIGQAVTMTVDVDESLIGGVVVKAGDLVIDSSVRGRLEQFKQALA